MEREIMAIDAAFHAEEQLLLEHESKQENLWGINLYPFAIDSKFIEFDSIINLRPGDGNRSRGVDNKDLQKKIIKIVNMWVEKC
jgi:hypothetical protein